MSTNEVVRDKVPKYYELMFPTLKALKALGGSATNEEILDKVSELEKFSEEVQKAQRAEHRQTILSYRLHWARSYLKRVGAIANNERGVWTLTEKGASLSQQDCEKVPSLVRKQDYEKRKARIKELRTSDDVPPDEEDDDETSWQDTLLSVLLE